MERKYLEKLKRADLQKLAKIHAIKANKKNAEIIDELLEKDLKTATDKNNESLHLSENPEQQGKQNVLQKNGHNGRKSEVDKDSKPKSNLKPSEINISDVVPKQSKSFIPKLNSSAHKKKINWEAIHKNCFEKMESIGDYLQKKTERREQLKCAFKNVTQDAQSILAQMKNAHNTPVASKSPIPARKISLSQAKRNINTPKAFLKGNTNSPRTVVTKTPKDGIAKLSFQPPSSLSRCEYRFKFGRQSTSNTKSNGKATHSTVQKAKESANLSKKLNRTTCFDFRSPTLKPITNLNTTTNTTPAKKFDLKESLKKPLPYKPHVGKVKGLGENYTNKEQAAEKRRVDVKAIQNRKTKDDRRITANQNRKTLKMNAVNKRRGIV